MPGEYTPQLEEIVRALHGSTPTWMIALFSAFLGFLASVLGQVFQHWYIEYRSRTKMRTIIYSELGAMYSMLVQFQPTLVSSNDEAQSYEGERKQLKDRFLRREGAEFAKKFDGEKYIEAHEDVFVQLRERSSIVLLYDLMHRVVGDESLGFLVLSLMAIQNLEYEVRCGSLPKKYIRRYMSAHTVALIDQGIEKQKLGDTLADSYHGR
jgi:hypothetical protein